MAIEQYIRLAYTPPPPGVDTNLENKPGAAPKSIRERQRHVAPSPFSTVVRGNDS